MEDLRSDFRYCENIIKNHSKTFYRGFSMLPEKKAETVYAVYAFCRIADDAVDVKKSPEALAQLRNELDLMLADRTPETPPWRALKDVFSRFEMDARPFYDMLEGQRRDLEFRQPENMNELEDYCYYVAGTVGLMLLPVLAEKNHRTLSESAVKLGRAMQITNILRDVGEDLRLNRIYLPEELMKKHNCTEGLLRSADFQAGNISPGFKELWEELAAAAEGYYREFEQHLALFDPDSRFPLLAASRLYRAILGTVRESGYDCITKRNRVSKINKKTIILSVRKEVAV